MEKKVIFATSIPFMKQHITDMYIHEIGEKYIVEMWDLSQLFGCKDEVDNTFSDTKTFSTINELDMALGQESKQYEIIIVTNILNSYLGKIIGVIHKLNIPIVCINKESFNTWLFEQGTFKYRKYFHWKARLQAFALRFPITRYLLNKRQFGKYQYDYLLASQNYYKMQAKHFIKIHHIKYDEYLTAVKTEKGIKGKYILFVDAGPSSHPAFCNRHNSLDHNDYLKRINEYLDYIEETTGLPVIISAHPKSSYKDGDFMNRRIYCGNTAELIHYSEGVVSHYSTSLVNAVLEGKPIQVIFYDNMFTSAFRGSIIMGLELADLCGADICDMKKPHKWDMAYNNVLYRKFIERHVCSMEFMDKSNAVLIRESLGRIFEGGTDS